jgi:RNA polymerase sigma-70 factor (ECF subfamily)
MPKAEPGWPPDTTLSHRRPLRVGPTSQTRQQEGHDDAFEALFRHQLMTHLPAVRRYAVHLVGVRDQVDDLVNEAVKHALDRRYQWTQGRSFKAWFKMIVKNKGLDAQRKAACDPVAWGEELDLNRQDVSAGTTGFFNCEAEKLLGQLTPRDRLLIDLCRAGYTHAEIATEVGMPIGSVMTRIHRARKKMRALLQEGSDS